MKIRYVLRNHSPLDATILTPDGGVMVGQCRADGERICTTFNELLADLEALKASRGPSTSWNRIPLRNNLVRQMMELPAVMQ